MNLCGVKLGDCVSRSIRGKLCEILFLLPHILFCQTCEVRPGEAEMSGNQDSEGLSITFKIKIDIRYLQAE